MSSSEPDQAVWALWGKAQRAPGDVGPAWHPLVCHMLDVMNVADLLIDRLPPSARAILERPFGNGTDARVWLRALVALHDMGKATQGFQQKWQGNLALRLASGLANNVAGECHRHGVTGTAILAGVLQRADLLGAAVLSSELAIALARAVASHHGEFALSRVVQQCAAGHLARQHRAGAWATVHDELARTVLNIALDGEKLPPIPRNTDVDPAFLMLLAGLTCVADWLGSDAEIFVYQSSPVDISHYQSVSCARAAQVLAKAGWQGSAARVSRTFEELFPFPARSLQVEVQSALAQLEGPALLIIEASMGDGKTEAALLVAEALGPRVGNDGIYIGLPTQATSNQMLGRVETFLGRTQPGWSNLQLVHGDAILSPRFSELKLRAIYDGGRDAGVGACVWFSQSRRALLAPFAVGTIDQALLGALQTKHGFVRLFGLAGKTVILDEVHAYDAYTSRILDRLVEWLSVLGSTVVILSATLPEQRRRELIEAYGGQLTLQEAAYPRITACTRGAMAQSLPTKPSRKSQDVQLRREQDDVSGIASKLALSITDGGTAAWICNSVTRAQAAYVELKRLREIGVLPADTVLDLLHSRFLRKDRQIREQRVEDLYGPRAGARPARGILVGTQVLEQSLDLDFDVMISDLAPIDLLLQRSGRLHRHQRQRPIAHQSPTLWVVLPPLKDEIPDLASVAYVYTEAAADIMLRTWWEVQRAEALAIPDQIEELIGRVYGTEPLETGDAALEAALEAAMVDASNKRDAQAVAAQGKLFPPVSYAAENGFGDCYADLKEDDDGNVDINLRAATRLGEDSIDVVCLWTCVGAGLSFDAEGRQPIDLEKPPSFDTVRRLVEHAVKVPSRSLARFRDLLIEPTAWRSHASLKHRLLLQLGPIAGAAGLRLDEDLGLITRFSAEAR